jgi:hypothetical protein
MCDFEDLCFDKFDEYWLGLLFEIFLFAYCFMALALICDKYLVVSLETLCKFGFTACAHSFRFFRACIEMPLKTFAFTV